MSALVREAMLIGTVGMFAALRVAAGSGASPDAAKVILLGTGTPIPDPTASGPAVVVVVNEQAYLFDAGPGVVRQAQAAAEKFRLAALDPTNLTHLFITHLHSDHTLGYPDVMLTPWVVGRLQPLEVYGPLGTAAMTDRLKEAYAADIKIRSDGAEGLRRRPLDVRVHEIAKPGEIYRDANVTVTALNVPHGSWPQAFGYAIDAAGRSIVISGDTAPTDEITKACRACDVLVHEVYSDYRFKIVFGPERRSYHSTFHTSTTQLAEIAAKAKPKLLVLYHQLYFGPRDEVDLEKEIRRTYTGNVVNGRDLTAY
ncbi:MAG: MBL fold metallo-hydrolase [Bryobacteraceae bacterium]